MVRYEFNHKVKGGVYWTFDSYFPKVEWHYIKKYSDLDKDELYSLVWGYASNDKNYKLKEIIVKYPPDSINLNTPVFLIEPKKYQRNKIKWIDEQIRSLDISKIVKVSFYYKTAKGNTGSIHLEKHKER